jgi:uncharacterized protein (TIGR02444 family)
VPIKTIQNAIDDFWQLSVAFYRQASPQLLALQNQHDKNINRLLFCLWFSYRMQCVLEESPIEWINQHCKPLERFIEQVRKTRLGYQSYNEQYCQINFESIKKRLLDCELALEKKHQTYLVMSLSSRIGGDSNRLMQEPVKVGYQEVDQNLALYQKNLTLLCGELDCEAFQNQTSASYRKIIQDWYEFIEQSKI